MIYRDPKCVFVADSMSQAEAVVLMLASADVAAQVMNPATLGGLVGLTVVSPHGVSANGVEVWVTDPNQAGQAIELLGEHAVNLAARKARAAALPAQIEAACDECGKANLFPGKECGTVQHCAYCYAYMDVPDPTEDAEISGETEEFMTEDEEPN
jgi:hypothetical protein